MTLLDDLLTENIHLRGQREIFTVKKHIVTPELISLRNLILCETQSNMVLEGIKLLYKLSTMYDLIIVFTNTLEKALSRRENAGLRANGKYINPKFWPIFHLAYSWLIKYYAPLLSEYYNTGLIVIDGRESPDRNFKILMDLVCDTIKVDSFYS